MSEVTTRRYYIKRVKDGRGENICKKYEEEINKIGGIWLADNSPDVKRGISADYYTELFHPRCRCHLVPTPEGWEITDEIDEMVILQNGTISLLFNNRNIEYVKAQNLNFTQRYLQVMGQMQSQLNINLED